MCADCETFGGVFIIVLTMFLSQYPPTAFSSEQMSSLFNGLHVCYPITWDFPNT